jgi:hypothetical protein
MERLVLCERHSWAAMVDTHKPALAPVSLLCPLCIAERGDNPNVGEGSRAVDGKASVAELKLTMSPKVADAYDEWRAKQAREGKLDPHSWEAEDALRVMDEARPDVIARDHGARMGRGRLVTIRGGSDGELVSYRVRRGERGLRRVS